MRNYPIIMLGAGATTHAGSPCGLVEYNGRPWVLRQLRQVSAAHGHRVVLVLGANATDYLAALPWMESSRKAPVSVEGMIVSTVIVDHPELGLFAALQAGAGALMPEKFAGAYVLPVEVPAAKLDVWTHLKMHLTGDVAACVPEFERRAGYPILLSHRYLETLLEMPPESKLDVQLKILPSDRMQAVPVDEPSVCMSIGSAEQWHRFLRSGPVA